MVSSCSLTFCKIAILLIFPKFKGKQPRWSHFLVKFACTCFQRLQRNWWNWGYVVWACNIYKYVSFAKLSRLYYKKAKKIVFTNQRSPYNINPTIQLLNDQAASYMHELGSFCVFVIFDWITQCNLILNAWGV